MKDPHINPKHLTKSAYRDGNKIDLRNEIQEEYGSHPVPWFEWVFAHLELPPQSQLLELGCGSGSIWLKNHPRVPSGWKIILSDLSHNMVQSARLNVIGLDKSWAFTGVNSQELPFADGSFDAILAIGVLDYLPDLHKALEEIWRVLRPSGMLLASAGGKRHLAELQSLLKPYLPRDRVEILGGEEERFGLENGKQILSKYFKEVVRHDYRTVMKFTEAQPILDYIFSETEVISAMNLEQMGALVHKVKRSLAEQEKFHVTIEKGLFAAKKKIVQ